MHPQHYRQRDHGYGALYFDDRGRPIELYELLEWPVYSRKQMPNAVTVDIEFFNETGGITADGNIDNPGQFSNSQFYVAHEIHTKLFTNNENPFDAVADINRISEVIGVSVFKIVKNIGQKINKALAGYLLCPTAPLGTAAAGYAWAAIERSLSGIVELNQPIVFGPGEKFTFTQHVAAITDLTALDVFHEFRGYLGVEKSVEPPK